CNIRKTDCLYHSPEDADAKNAAHSTGTIQALGVTAMDKLRVQSTSGTWDRNQSILLCSDGLLDGCDAALLHQVLGDTGISAQEAVEQLLFQALQGNADNNITAVLLRLN
ncbi:MAG: hypothetical protein KA218_03240, partial [Arenimonas sp.]|nr:hypothetical protein [Arenimonas sp.]